MVIERALEKLKQANSLNTGTMPALERAPARRVTDSQPEQRRKTRTTIDPTLPRPTFPRLECNRDLAIQHHLVLPGTPLAADARVLASYRMLRTRLLNQISANGWMTLAMTSPGAAEGKSVTSINLALNIAREGSRSVFLLDLDMRHPTICRYLGVEPRQELISYFQGEADPQNVFFSIGADNLAIAGNLSSSEHASELLAGERLENLFHYIKSIAPAPLILLDLPPVLVTDEPLMIAPRVDAMLLVVADGQTRRDSLLRVKELLHGYPLAGVVLNKSTETVSSSGEYYGYSYGAQK